MFVKRQSSSCEYMIQMYNKKWQKRKVLWLRRALLYWMTSSAEKKSKRCKRECEAPPQSCVVAVCTRWYFCWCPFSSRDPEPAQRSCFDLWGDSSVPARQTRTHRRSELWGTRVRAQISTLFGPVHMEGSRRTRSSGRQSSDFVLVPPRSRGLFPFHIQTSQASITGFTGRLAWERTIDW